MRIVKCYNSPCDEYIIRDIEAVYKDLLQRKSNRVIDTTQKWLNVSYRGFRALLKLKCMLVTTMNGLILLFQTIRQLECYTIPELKTDY